MHDYLETLKVPAFAIFTVLLSKALGDPHTFASWLVILASFGFTARRWYIMEKKYKAEKKKNDKNISVPKK